MFPFFHDDVARTEPMHFLSGHHQVVLFHELSGLAVIENQAIDFLEQCLKLLPCDVEP